MRNERTALKTFGEYCGTALLALGLFAMCIAQAEKEAELEAMARPEPIEPIIKPVIEVEPVETPAEVLAEVEISPVTDFSVEVDEVVVEEEKADTAQNIALYDVPLEADLQIHIIEQAEAHGIDPAIIFAMCYRESSYDPSDIGDGGNSLGIMQVQPRYHRERMERLGCTDLLDPFQCVTVGVDYLAEQLERYGDIEKALTAYNAGHYKGTVTQYARNVLATAEELKVME